MPVTLLLTMIHKKGFSLSILRLAEMDLRGVFPLYV